MRFIYGDNNQQGVVSILSVIFFIILMSVLTVSFLRIVTDQQTQTINDDLSKGALASAQSGVEDAKRALLYCRKNPLAPSCASLGNQTCPGAFADPAMKSQLGLNALADGSIKVGDPTNKLNQRYTCVTITINTDHYEGTADETKTNIIPLRGISSFNKIRFSWRPIIDEAAIPTSTEVPINATPRKPEWKNAVGKKYLAVPRLQLINFDHTKSLTAMRDNSVGMFLFPYSDNTGQTDSSTHKTEVALGSAPNAINPASLANKHVAVSCSGPEADYQCSATITFPAPNVDQEYYLALKSVYDSTKYKVELINDIDGSIVAFNNVQPRVDSTGAADDVYKRVISNVEYQLDSFKTSSAIESGGGVCKDFLVTRLTATGRTSCLGF